MIQPLNLEVENKMSGVAGDFGPDGDGDFAVAGRKLSWKDQTVLYKVIKLTEVKVGDELVSINFNNHNLPMFLNPDAGLSGFQWVVWSGTSGAGINISVAWNANSIQDGNMNYIYNVPSGDLTIPNWLEDTCIFPENTIVTEMRDLGGNRQNWEDVVVGCDPSGWNPSMATVKVKVSPINTADNKSIENSGNLVTSDGIWNDTHYVVESTSTQKTLYDIKVGDDMSNITLTLPYLSVSTGGLPTIRFTNGTDIGFTDGTGVSWGINGTGETSGFWEWAVSGHITKESYTFGDGYIVQSIENMNDTANIPKLITFTTNSTKRVVSFSDHVENDKGYWKTLQKTQNLVTSLQTILMGLQSSNNDLKARVAILEDQPVPEPDPVYDMTTGTVLHSPALIGILGLEILGIDEIGSGWTAPSDGLIVVDNASGISILSPNWIAVNGVKAAPSGSTVIIQVIGGSDGGNIPIKAGDIITQSGMGNITFYKRIN